MNTDPERADVTTAVAEQLARGLAACDRLERFAVGMTSPWGGRELGDEPQADMLLVALFTRSYATFSADVELVRLGFGEQAAMLNRSLFEDMVDAHWIATYPDAAVELMRDHHMHGRMLLADAAAKYPSFYGNLEVPKFDPEERKRLDGVFGKFGHKSWTRLNLHERVTQIEHFWESSDEALEALRFYRDIPQRENNQTLHVSAFALAATVCGRDQNNVTFTMGASTSMVDRTLLGAFWIFSQTVGLVLDHFGFEVDGEGRAEVFSARDFIELDADAVRGVGRNNPCPGGSGQKLKRCHGA